MFPIIEVQCPHCKATGQIMTPPLGSIIVGPCPRCDEMVLLFDGTVMAIDKDVIADGTPEEKKQHLLEAIVDMVASKVDELIETGELRTNSEHRKNRQPGPTATEMVAPSIRNREAPHISRADIRDFINIDLHLIDSKAHFDKIFATEKKSRTSRDKHKR